MARGRIISNSISTSKKFSRLANNNHRLMYLMLIPHVDADGRHDADPRILNGQVYTLLNFTNDEVRTALNDMRDVELIHLYAVKDDPFLELVDFLEHNTPHHRERKDLLPSPDEGTPLDTQENMLQRSKAEARPKHEPSNAEACQPFPSELNRSEVKGSKENRRMSAGADDTPTLQKLIEIWNEHSGDLRKVRDAEAALVNPDLQRLTALFVKRHKPAKAIELFRTGIEAVKVDPHWLGNRATPIKTNRAPYGILNYLRHVEDKAEEATALSEDAYVPAYAQTIDTYKPHRPFRVDDLVQRFDDQDTALIDELLPDGHARLNNGQTWNLAEVRLCDN